jgi:hypothetical protein
MDYFTSISIDDRVLYPRGIVGVSAAGLWKQELCGGLG